MVSPEADCRAYAALAAVLQSGLLRDYKVLTKFILGRNHAERQLWYSYIFSCYPSTVFATTGISSSTIFSFSVFSFPYRLRFP